MVGVPFSTRQGGKASRLQSNQNQHASRGNVVGKRKTFVAVERSAVSVVSSGGFVKDGVVRQSSASSRNGLTHVGRSAAAASPNIAMVHSGMIDQAKQAVSLHN